MFCKRPVVGPRPNVVIDLDMDEILVRDARPEDLAVIVAQNQALAVESEAMGLEADVLTRGVAAALAEPDRLRYWVAEVTGKVVGQTAVSREWSDWRNGWLWWLQSVFVAPEHRGRGVFRALHAHVRKTALAQADVVGLRLYVEESNFAAQRTYLQLGMDHGGYHVYEEIWPRRAGDWPE